MQIGRSTVLVSQQLMPARRSAGRVNATARAIDDAGSGPRQSGKEGARTAEPSQNAERRLTVQAQTFTVTPDWTPATRPLPLNTQRALAAYQVGVADARSAYLHQILGVDVFA